MSWDSRNVLVTPGACSSAPSFSSTQMKLRSQVHLLKPYWDLGYQSGARTEKRSHHTSSGSFLHHPGAWARTKVRVETSGGSGKSSSNFRRTNISLGGTLPACGPVIQMFHQGLKLLLWAEHLTWFQSFPGISIGLQHRNRKRWWRAPSSLSSLSSLFGLWI